MLAFQFGYELFCFTYLASETLDTNPVKLLVRLISSKANSSSNIFVYVIKGWKNLGDCIDQIANVTGWQTDSNLDAYSTIRILHGNLHPALWLSLGPHIWWYKLFSTTAGVRVGLFLLPPITTATAPVHGWYQLSTTNPCLVQDTRCWYQYLSLLSSPIWRLLKLESLLQRAFLKTTVTLDDNVKILLNVYMYVLLSQLSSTTIGKLPSK